MRAGVVFWRDAAPRSVPCETPRILRRELLIEPKLDIVQLHHALLLGRIQRLEEGFIPHSATHGTKQLSGS